MFETLTGARVELVAPARRQGAPEWPSGIFYIGRGHVFVVSHEDITKMIPMHPMPTALLSSKDLPQ
jgi:hypothetical protein